MSDHNIRFYALRNLLSDLTVSHSQMPEDKRAFLHGFCDYFGAGEACSFSTSDSEVGTENDPDSRPLEHGSGSEVEAYRAGWKFAAK